jgi:hypothetical protein
MSFVIEVDNGYRIVKPRNTYWSLQELQDLVGGYIERVPSESSHVDIYVNEEGLLHQLPLNVAGTRVAGHYGHAQAHPMPFQRIGLVGPVAFIDVKELNEEQEDN